MAERLQLTPKREVALVFVAGLAVWWLEALIIPLGPGRDLGTYVGAYVQLFHSNPIDIGYVLGRTPLSPLVIGGLLQFAHGALAEPVMSILYAGSIVAWFLAARLFSRRAALLTAVVLLVYPGYGILFHELSSDAVFAAAFAGWSLLVVHTVLAPSWRRFALVGLGVGILTLIRPSNQVLLAVVLLPLFVRAAGRTRAVWALAFAVPAAVVLGGWVLNNGLRYDDYILVRGGNATVPFYRTFVTDRIVRPSNGPKSRELANAVQRDLLPKEPYRSYGITLTDFFEHASPRMEVDLVALSDRLKGWYTNDRWLRQVGVEAVRTHPAKYSRGVATTVWQLLTQDLYRTPSTPAASQPAQAPVPTTAPLNAGASGGATIVVNGKRLPKPTEGEPIPSPHEGGVTTPHRTIYTVWTSPAAHHLVFVRPGDEARYLALHRRMDELARNLPTRSGSASLAHRLNQASRGFPPALFWLVLGVIGFLIRRARHPLAVAAPTVAGLLVVVVSALGLPSEPHYSVPVAPAFVFLAGAGLFAARRQRATTQPALSPAARRVAGIALGVAAAAGAVAIYVDFLRKHIEGAGAPHDLDVFLGAAGKVVHGVSPYVLAADKTFAYPPLLAYVVASLHPISGSAAAIIWLVVSLAAIALSLWLLDVRDWRCYAFAAVYPFTRSAIDLGTVAPLLLLAIAIAWRWRDELVGSSLAVGAAIALKLFLWPAAVWLAITRRIWSAVAAVVFAVALVLVPWAIIGFAGIGDYPSLLRHLSRQEASSSYSGTAFGVRAHIPYSVSLALSLVVGLALLAAAVWVARDERRSPRDRDVATLTLALAAALVASPIVWVHYFLLLLVPLALTRPRLSPLWLVPFAYYPLGESAWPAGDARKLALALVTTAILIGAALVRGAGDVRRPAQDAPAARNLRPRRLRRPAAALERRELPEAPQPR